MGSVRALLVCCAITVAAWASDGEKPRKFLEPISVEVPHISTDRDIKYDYDIVYVRAQRSGDQDWKRYFADFSAPVTMEPQADLMLLHPDGREEVLVKGGDGGIIDPVVSFDAQWVYYSHIHILKNGNQWTPPREGADIYKIHLQSRKIIRLTNQRFSPNTGAAHWSRDYRTPQAGKSHISYGVFNTGPFPLPGGRIAFTSNRDGFRPAKGYAVIALQLFVMDDRDTDIDPLDDPQNLDKIGHLNISGALHPVVLADGRIMYSSLESEGLRGTVSWGVWTIHPDGTNWAPMVSAFDTPIPPNGFHFQTQLSDKTIVVEKYYNQNNSGFGAYVKLPPTPPDGYPAFGPAFMGDPRNGPWRFGRDDHGNPRMSRMPFMPTGSISLTPFAHGEDGPADRSIRGDKTSAAVGKVSHPSGAPDNHLLTAYSPGPVNHQYTHLPQIDSGIYLIKNGDVVEQPSQMRLIKNDPNYNECWPRAVVPYRRIYGVNEPHLIPRLKNDGQLSQHLPAGTPFGLVGTSSFYKRESFPNGVVAKGSVTATNPRPGDPWKGIDPFMVRGNNASTLNWQNQGADAGIYTNDEIHAVRILVMEATTDRMGANAGRKFFNHASERLRILGEIPLRKFAEGAQPKDPDGNPDTSFLARIPADTAFTFQTLDRRGMVLNMAQTWHQLRSGEIRTNCGGCHAHSQQPTDFGQTIAAKESYKLWDLAAGTPMLTDKASDESRRKWDDLDETGLRIAKAGPVNVEYYRDIHPIFQRSCIACHTGSTAAGNLDLDADHEPVATKSNGSVPGTYYRLAMDGDAKFGHKPAGWDNWGAPNASRYVRMFQSRRSLLIWKIFGQRLDGFNNEDNPSESEPGKPETFADHGQLIDLKKNRHRMDLDYLGTPMPPPDAAKSGKVPPLTDEDRKTIVRWVDLGCPIDLDFDPKQPSRAGFGWMSDDQRPTLTMATPQSGCNSEITRILIGMHDYGSGLNPNIFLVTADFPFDGIPARENIARRFQQITPGVWEMRLEKPITELKQGTLKVLVSDKQGNATELKRTFSVEQPRQK